MFCQFQIWAIPLQQRIPEAKDIYALPILIQILVLWFFFPENLSYLPLGWKNTKLYLLMWNVNDTYIYIYVYMYLCINYISIYIIQKCQCDMICYADNIFQRICLFYHIYLVSHLSSWCYIFCLAKKYICFQNIIGLLFVVGSKKNIGSNFLYCHEKPIITTKSYLKGYVAKYYSWKPPKILQLQRNCSLKCGWMYVEHDTVL